MEDRNKTVAELISDLQNQLNKANNRIDELVVVNKSLNKALIKDMYKNILNARYGITGLGLYYESTDDGYTKYLEGLLLKEKAKNTDLQNELDKANNHIEELTHKNTKLIVENVLLEEDDVRWHNKYTKEKAKHDKATKKIDELKKYQKDELAWSYDKRRHNIIDSLYQETKYNKNDENDKRREMKHAKDYGWFQYDSLDKWRLF